MSTSMAGRKLYWSDVVSPTGESVVSSWQDIGFDLAVGTDIAEFSTPAFSIHPNPASDEVKLLRNPALQGSVTLNVIDAAGRIVLVRTLSAGGASEVARTDGLPNGLYELQRSQRTAGGSPNDWRSHAEQLFAVKFPEVL